MILLSPRFVMLEQVQRNWCWAAVCISVLRHYHPSAALKKCDLVNNKTGLHFCCNPVQASTNNCNVPSNTWYELHCLHLYDSELPGPASIEEIAQEIEANRPVAARVSFYDFQHVVVISGVDLNQGKLLIDDPWPDRDVILYDSFLTHYKGNGEWIGTCFTKPPRPNGTFLS